MSARRRKPAKPEPETAAANATVPAAKQSSAENAVQKRLATGRLRNRILSSPETPPHILWSKTRQKALIDYEYYKRMEHCRKLADVMVALKAAFDAGLTKYIRTVEGVQRRAEKEYAALWIELIEMSKFSDADNPYTDKKSKRAWALRTRVRRGDLNK